MHSSFYLAILGDIALWDIIIKLSTICLSLAMLLPLPICVKTLV